LPEDGTVMYLYTQPINSVSQERELVTRDNKENGEPVAIKKEREKDCDMEVIEKKINLNGEAI